MSESCEYCQEWREDCGKLMKENEALKAHRERLREALAFALDKIGLEAVWEETPEQYVNLCDKCSKHFATCKSNPKFGCGKGNDNVFECDAFTPKKEAE
jgi:regulator of replication initiation timing